jgi:hypothetical protein
VADTLWLDETFSDGPIAWDVAPPHWNTGDDWWWDVADGGNPPTNYPRMRLLESVDVASGQ